MVYHLINLRPIDFKVGVKQGDSMSPVLFLFLMMDSKILEDEWTVLGPSKAKFSCKDNSPISTGKLVSHQPGTFSFAMIFYLFCIIYVDNGTFVFESRTKIEKGITLLSNHFDRFGLEMHIGTTTPPPPQILNAYFPRPHVSLIHKHYG